MRYDRIPAELLGRIIEKGIELHRLCREAADEAAVSDFEPLQRWIDVWKDVKKDRES